MDKKKLPLLVFDKVALLIFLLYFCSLLKYKSEQRNLMYFNGVVKLICLVSKVLRFEMASYGNNADCLSFFDLNFGNPLCCLKNF